jgi:hypothetical protein
MTEMVRIPGGKWTQAAYLNLVFSVNPVDVRMLGDPGRDGPKIP